MSAGLMENNPPKSVLYGHGHGARLDITGVEHGDSLGGSLPAQLLRVQILKKFQSFSGPGTHAAGLVLPIFAGNGRNRNPGANLPVLCKQPLTGGNEDLMVHFHIVAVDLGYFIVILFRRQAGLPEVIDFIGIFHSCGHNFHRMNVSEQSLPQYNIRNPAALRHGGSHPGRTVQHCLRRQGGSGS